MKKIMAIIVFLLLIIVGGYMFSSQYKWSSELNVAINQGDVNRIKELLKDDSKDVNFAGKSVRNFGRERPLEFACYCEKVDYKVVELLIRHGAKQIQRTIELLPIIMINTCMKMLSSCLPLEQSL